MEIGSLVVAVKFGHENHVGIAMFSDRQANKAVGINQYQSVVNQVGRESDLEVYRANNMPADTFRREYFEEVALHLRPVNDFPNSSIKVFKIPNISCLLGFVGEGAYKFAFIRDPTVRFDLHSYQPTAAEFFRKLDSVMRLTEAPYINHLSRNVPHLVPTLKRKGLGVILIAVFGQVAEYGRNNAHSLAQMDPGAFTNPVFFTIRPNYVINPEVPGYIPIITEVPGPVASFGFGSEIVLNKVFPISNQRVHFDRSFNSATTLITDQVYYGIKKAFNSQNDFHFLPPLRVIDKNLVGFATSTNGDWSTIHRYPRDECHKQRPLPEFNIFTCGELVW